jgi:hypothetical protein
LAFLFVIWYFSPRYGILLKEKSGNPYLVTLAAMFLIAIFAAATFLPQLICFCGASFDNIFLPPFCAYFFYSDF